MWIGRFGSTANRWWGHEAHIPLPWKGLPTYEVGLQHVDKFTLDRVRNVFPDGELVLKGVYFSKDEPNV